MKNRSAEHGNVLWFILIAVVLLGALTMALSRSATNVEQSGNIEQQRIKSSQILRYAKSLETAVEQLILSGCSENEISFHTPGDTNYNNAKSPANERCHVFSAKGAGMTWQVLSGISSFNPGQDFGVFGHFKVLGVGDDAKPELTMMISAGKEICLQVNKDLGISVDDADITTNVDEYADSFYGDYWEAFTIGGPTSLALNAKRTGCMRDDMGGYVIYHVLLAR